MRTHLPYSIFHVFSLSKLAISVPLFSHYPLWALPAAPPLGMIPQKPGRGQQQWEAAAGEGRTSAGLGQDLSPRIALAAS